MTKFLAVLSAAALFSGCSTLTVQNWDQKLPQVQATEVSIQENTPYFNVALKASGLSVTESEVRADSVEYTRAGRVSSATITIKGYKRVKTETLKTPETK